MSRFESLCTSPETVKASWKLWNAVQYCIRLLVSIGDSIAHFHCFSMDVLFDTRDDHTVMAIMAYPNERHSLFDAKISFKPKIRRRGRARVCTMGKE